VKPGAHEWPGFVVLAPGFAQKHRTRRKMNYEPAMHRRPYRRGDFHFVVRPHEGAYWRSREGVIVRVASGEGDLPRVRRNAPAWVGALALLLARTAGS
jgi:hypothetical protein